MYRNGLTDGCTLKVREILAMGLPIFSGHKDTALPFLIIFQKEVLKISLSFLERLLKLLEK